jgi:hypothetical protein
VIQHSISFCGSLERSLVMSAVLATLACGDNVSPPLTADTWEDTANIWADSYCQFSERCYADEFSELFGSQEKCVTYVAELNCDVLIVTCDTAYPATNLPDLAMCVADMEALACTATVVPASCVRAFRFE